MCSLYLWLGEVLGRMSPWTWPMQRTVPALFSGFLLVGNLQGDPGACFLFVESPPVDLE